MKFGKRLTSEASRHWDNQFLDYKACKKAVQKDVFAAGVPSDQEVYSATKLGCIPACELLNIRQLYKLGG